MPPAYTSKSCSRCGHVHPETDQKKSYRHGKKFKCGHCGFEHDADINAACNIAALGRSVSSPESPGFSCRLEGQLDLFLCSYALRLKPPNSIRGYAYDWKNVSIAL